MWILDQGEAKDERRFKASLGISSLSLPHPLWSPGGGRHPFQSLTSCIEAGTGQGKTVHYCLLLRSLERQTDRQILWDNGVEPWKLEEKTCLEGGGGPGGLLRRRWWARQTIFSPLSFFLFFQGLALKSQSSLPSQCIPSASRIPPPPPP